MTDNNDETPSNLDSDIETFKELGSLHSEVRNADIDHLSEADTKLYYEKEYALYLKYINLQAEMYSLPLNELEEDIANLKLAMDKLKKDLGNLDKINIVINSISSVVGIVTSILSYMKPVNMLLPLAESANFAKIQLGQSNTVPLEVYQLVLEERDYLRKVVSCFTCGKNSSQ